MVSTSAEGLERLEPGSNFVCHQAAALLAAQGLTRHRFHPKGLIKAAEFARIETPLRVAGNWIYTGDQLRQVRRVAAAARKLVSRDGAARVSAIVEALNSADLDVGAKDVQTAPQKG